MNSKISAFDYCLKMFLLPLSLLLFLQICHGQESPTTIAYPKVFPKEIVDDIQSLLHASTGRQWSAQQDKISDKGIILSINTSLSYKTGESCLINSDGLNYVKFESPTNSGLIYGVYKYLRDLGYKFYLPDSLYTFIPSLKSVFKKTSVMETPFLKIRDFFGTGGFGSGKTDPDQSVQKAWQLWKWRNGFGAEFMLAGHAGETFNLNNAKELEKHPEWTATPIMKNGQVDVSTKLNYYNQSAVDFFTDWAIKKFTDKSYKVPPVYLRDMVTVEPADGGGYVVNPPQGSELKTVSDQVFYAANVAAKKLDHLFPDQPNIGVSLYAYSGHADAPDFALNPRVFVQIIPYQFQNIAFGPAFIKRWSQKVKRFGLYDYFKYPDSYWDMPGGYTIDELMNRAIYATNTGSEGTTYESSYSKFSTAIPLWVLCQYMCTGDKNWRKDYDQLINDLYGKAAAAIKKLFDLFYFKVQFGSSDLMASVDFVRQAQKLSTDAHVLARINELELYLNYVFLYLQAQDLSKGDLEQRVLPVEKMAWTLYETKIIHSYRIMQLGSYTFLNAQTPDKSLAERYQKLHRLTFPESNDPDVFWKKGYGYSATEINQMFSNQRLKKTASTSNTTATIKEEVMAAKSAYKPKQTITLQSSYAQRGYFGLFCEKPSTVKINWSLTNTKGAASITISGADKNYKAVYDYPVKTTTGNLSISLPAGETSFFVHASANTSYILKMQLNNTFCYFDGSPRGKVGFLDDKEAFSYDPLYYPSYIYIPGNTSSVQYRVQVNALKIFTPNGEAVATKLISTSAGGFELRSFEVPAGFSGKFWKAVISNNYDYQFLNIPDRYFLLIEK